MRIISGTWRGQLLRVPKGVRATTDRTREAIFSILGNAQDLEVLDLYAGSGSLGIEALSRGAAAACFVDLSRQALRIIESNLAGKASRGVTLVRQDSLGFLRATESTYDWIFCDPPYQGIDFPSLIRTFWGAGFPFADYIRNRSFSQHQSSSGAGQCGPAEVRGYRDTFYQAIGFRQSRIAPCVSSVTPMAPAL